MKFPFMLKMHIIWFDQWHNSFQQIIANRFSQDVEEKKKII